MRRGVALALCLLVGISSATACTVQSRSAPPAVEARAPLPLLPPPDPVEQYAADRLSVMSLEQKIRSMLVVHRPGLDAAGLATFIANEGLAGTILMGSNVPEPPTELAEMTAQLMVDAGLPPLIAIDQEGGVVSRIRTDDAPGAWQLRELPPDAASVAFASRSALLASLGVNLNLGIVADVSSDPGSFIYDRSFGGTADEVAARVAQAVAGEHGTVLSTLKHFPGHGAVWGDSHSSIPTTDMSLDDWRAAHAPPYLAGIAAGADVVMVGHIRFAAVDDSPASLSPEWIEILREQLAFDGIVMTDDMSMLERSGEPALTDQAGNAVRAIAAGNTVLLYVGPVDIPGVVAAAAEAVLAGVIDASVIDDAARRLLTLRRTLSGQTSPYASGRGPL